MFNFFRGELWQCRLEVGKDSLEIMDSSHYLNDVILCVRLGKISVLTIGPYPDPKLLYETACINKYAPIRKLSRHVDRAGENGVI